MPTRPDRVLLVDDQPANIHVLAEALGDAYEVQFATSGEKALELAAGADLILLDVVMPDLDGFEVCRRLKANAATAAIPILFVTALGDVDDEERGFDAGGVDYIAKPINPAIVRARVRTHLALKKQKDLIEEVDRMSRHDLKTPLNSVISFASLIADDRSVPVSARDMASMIEHSGYRILEMVNRSLDLFRMEQGSYTIRAARIDVADIAKRAASELETKYVSCEVRGRGFARGEELLTYSMLANLIKNAVEASPVGGTVRIVVEDGEQISIRVTNSGAVPAELREHFFDKYTTANKRGGTGLGTYSARLMAETQGGCIALDPGDDTTTVVVMLPAYRERAFLIADDDEWTRAAMRKMLDQPGAIIDEAEDGAAAIEKCAQRAYDYVFIDLEMPVVSGLDALPKLHASNVVALSSHDDAATRERALAAGARIYLTKPATKQTLLETIGDVVRVDADIAELVPQFLEGKREEIERLNVSSSESIVKTSHRLKGSFRLYGFNEAARLCGEIEQRAAAGRMDEVPAMVGELAAHLERMRVEYA